jgi:hypothetical protein
MDDHRFLERLSDAVRKDGKELPGDVEVSVRSGDLIALMDIFMRTMDRNIRLADDRALLKTQLEAAQGALELIAAGKVGYPEVLARDLLRSKEKLDG